jgi:4-hydroxy-3-methylbut-2-en-1-yl diphosphate synthase IspG/GcpE
MRYEQTKDVLDHVVKFHRQAGEVFQTLMEHTSNQRVRMLLDYMVRHEKNLERRIAEFRGNASERVLFGWFKYTHDEDIFSALRQVDTDSDMEFDDVLDLAVELDAKLIELYEEMADRSPSEEVKEIFNCLLSQERREKNVLVRSALGLKDI